MINIERVKHMTHMAIYDKEYYSKYQQMLKYSKKDYVAVHGWGGFFVGTVVYAIVYGLVVLYLISEIFDRVSTLTALLLVLAGLILYAFYIILHVHNTRKRATKRYIKGRRAQKEVARQYEILLAMYEKENAAKTPEVVRNTQRIDLENIEDYE